MNLPDYLGSLGACPEAREWAAGYSTLAEAWTACDRADWLLWYAGRHDDVDRRLLVRAACACARTALPHVPPGEDRPRLAIELAEAWCNGRATIVEVRTAAYAAYAAYAADASYAAAAYAAYASYAAWSKAHLKMCVLVRALIPCPSEP